MKEIVFVSGKGGTGKTSLMAAFTSLAKNPVVADCDVDAADLFLLLQPQQQQPHPFIGGKQARIEANLCLREGICQQVCRFDAVRREMDGSYLIDLFHCEGCGVCAYFCIHGAIRLVADQAGAWYLSQTRFGPMVHAHLEPGRENSGKLVAIVRQEAQRICEEEGRDVLLVDGPPGIGCPAIASLVGAGLALAVSEPTVAAVHDLQRLLELVRQLKVRIALLINKWDINPIITTELEALAESRKLPLVGRISYHPSFTRAQREGKTIVEYGGPVADEICQAWLSINHEVQANGPEH